MKVPKESTTDMLRALSVAPKHNFILTLAMGITFGFSFACLLLNVISWEAPSRPPAPTPIRLVKISRSISEFEEPITLKNIVRSPSTNQFEIEDPHQGHNHLPFSIIKHPIHEVEMHSHEGKKDNFYCCCFEIVNKFGMTFPITIKFDNDEGAEKVLESIFHPFS